jgi:UDP-N-acetylglucosamine--N-acetylmuramyl-(pentapeptide) pyrophosphoryl-undecaprenol N-acetylglucosamine transferase
MRGPAVQTIVIAAGGTGGHFFPAEALAAELLARGHRIVLMTDARSGAIKSHVFAGHEQYVLPGAGIAGRGTWRGLRAVAGLAAGVMQARSVLSRLNAAAVVGFGGYPCVAPILGASLLKQRPVLVLHEQNAVLGRANRFLAKRVDRLALSFAGTEKVPPTVVSSPGLSRPSTTLAASAPLDMDGPAKPGHDVEGAADVAIGAIPSGPTTIVTGNPVRPDIAALSDIVYTAPIDRIRLAVLGGSLGARVFSDVVPPALAALPDELRHRLSLTQQCRTEDLGRVRASYAQSGIEAELSPFFPDVADRLAAVHLVIGRAGASTVAELAVAGRPAILVPLPGAIDDHQSANARVLAQAGAAAVMPQPAFTPVALTAALTEILSDPATLPAMAAAARTQGKPGAASRLADLVESLMNHDAAEFKA